MFSTLLLASLITAAPPEVKMYGASWCGPCYAVKSYLEQNKVPFRYLDIDDEKNFAEFLGEGGTSIPLVIIGREKIVGSNFERIAQSLSLAAQKQTTGEAYGGYPPSWWQAQFRDLRTRSADLAAKIDTLSRKASFDDEKRIVELLKRQQKIIDASIDTLEADASRVSLPRKYRE